MLPEPLVADHVVRVGLLIMKDPKQVRTISVGKISKKDPNSKNDFSRKIKTAITVSVRKIQTVGTVSDGKISGQ